MLGGRCVIISLILSYCFRKPGGEMSPRVCNVLVCAESAVGGHRGLGRQMGVGGVEEDGEGPLHYIPSCMF